MKRILGWPIRRLLQPWFNDVNVRILGTNQVTHAEGAATRRDLALHLSEIGSDLARDMNSVPPRVEEIVSAYASTQSDGLSLIGAQLRALTDEVRAVSDGRDQTYVERVNMLAEGSVNELDGGTAHLLNVAGGHRGFAAQRELWLNPSITLSYSEGNVELGSVNERIVELPFAFRALARISPPGPVLDVGSVESSLPLSLASLGYDVTALDQRPYRFTHPRLTTVQSRLENWDPGGARFAAILCVSTIEHMGLGWYGEQPESDGADARAVARLRDLLAPDGILVLTVPYGPASVDEVQRVYDDAGLAALLSGWEVEERAIVARADDVTWTSTDGSGTGEGVALVVARPQAAT